MQLTTKMKAEINTIQKGAEHTTQNVFSILGGGRGAISFETKKLCDASIRELVAYKVRLENSLCQTDIKEQDHL